MIAIVDYGVGNLQSIKNALDFLKYESIITSNIEEINNSKGIILPGVGAFNGAMKNLNNLELVGTIKENINNKKPLLGICLGMQILFNKSYEDGQWEGLNILEGNVIKFNENLKVPHMGWNKLIKRERDPIMKYIEDDSYVYFVHSYYIDTLKDTVAYCDYGVDVPGIVRKNNVYGMQFHPEKSGAVGLQLLKGFGELIK